MKRIAIAAILALMAFAPAHADTTVKYLNISTGTDKDLMVEVAKEYEAAHPGVHIELPTLENEAFKAKLTTLLQSPDAPDLFHSWGGGVFAEQAKAGVLRSVDDVLSQDAKDAIGAAGVAAFTAPDGHIYGLARDVSGVVIWYNKKLFAQAGVDPASMGTWDGMLAGVKKLKDAGVTPFALGGKDKWPAQFFYGSLISRIAGHAEFDAAAAGTAKFSDPDFVKAGELLLQLAALEPWQEGYLAATYGDAAGAFGDGKAAMHFMGDWDYNVAKDSSATKAGIPDEDMGIMPFPSVDGAKDDGAHATLGGVSGYLFGKNASDEAVKFTEWYNSAEVQKRFAAAGYYIPIAKGAADTMTNPFKIEVAKMVQGSTWHALFFDQALGPAVGGTFNDLAIGLASGELTAQDAADQLQQAAEDNR